MSAANRYIRRSTDEAQTLSLRAIAGFLDDWSRHWEAISALQEEMTPEQWASVSRLPSDPTEALRGSRSGSAHSFHPDVVSSFVDTLRATQQTIEHLLSEAQVPDGPDLPVEDALRNLKKRVESLESIVVGAGAVMRSLPRDAGDDRD